MATQVTPRQEVQHVLRRAQPGRIVYAPNYWQWFTHHRNHNVLPPELRPCSSQLQVIDYLGLDVFSRNLYCDHTRHWFGGLSEETWDGVEVRVQRRTEGRDIVTEKTYQTPRGALTERLRFVFDESTLVQEKYLLEDYAAELDAFLHLAGARRWKFERSRYERVQAEVGDRGVVVAGELFSPLKLLHLAAGQAGAVYLLADFPDRCAEIMALHQAAQLDLIRQMLQGGVPVMMAMDNLDAMFHTPRLIDRCSAAFYEQASRMCRAGGSAFFIHACGRQRAILPLIASLGVDGLEGVAFPPLGDVELEEAMALCGERMIITGGISAMQTEGLHSAAAVLRYLEDLLARMAPYRHRFMLSASCNTSIKTPWKTIAWFRDAWRQLSAGAG